MVPGLCQALCYMATYGRKLRNCLWCSINIKLTPGAGQINSHHKNGHVKIINAMATVNYA